MLEVKVNKKPIGRRCFVEKKRREIIPLFKHLHCDLFLGAITSSDVEI